MTPEDVRKRVEMISEWTWDYERAHSMEDKLFEDVLEAVAACMDLDSANELASEALKSRQLIFSRLCA